MIAFLFTLALFAYWGILGFALITLFPPRLRTVQTVLIAPSLGVATLLLPVFFINRMGYPIAQFGRPLAGALFILAALILAWNRPLFPARRLRLYAVILIAALLLSSWPMFLYGFDWVSYANDDMANYCLAAERFLQHGFFDVPNMDNFVAGKEYSLAYWFMHVAHNQRSGAELVEAEIWAATGLNAHQNFMPTIMALNLALISSASALVAGRGSRRKTPLIAMGLLAVSPLNTLGALYQLIGQVGGIGALCAAVTLTYRPQALQPRMRLVRRNAAAAAILMTLMIWYPEVLPFFGAGWLMYICVASRLNWRRILAIAVPAAVIGLLILAVLNHYVFSMVTFMLSQLGVSEQSLGMHTPTIDKSVLLFPYYLIPSGIPAVWGLSSIVDHVPDPWISLLILTAMFLSGWFLTCALPREFKRASPPAMIAAIMLVLFVAFYYKIMDFFLFKMAMYFQPFLYGVVAAAIVRHIRRKMWVKPAIAVLAAIALFIQYDYVSRSTGEAAGGLNELPHASAQKVNRQFDALMKTLPKSDDTVFLATTNNVILAKFQMLYSGGYQLLFPSNNYIASIAPTNKDAPAHPVEFKADDATPLRTSYGHSNMYAIQTINGNDFVTIQPGLLTGKRIDLVITSGTDIFNRYEEPSSRDFGWFRTEPLGQAVNVLQFVNSSEGPHYYSFGNKKKTAFYQLESDPMFPGKDMSALGRHLLFRVYNPLPRTRLVMELTDTVVKQSESLLPQATVQNTAMPFIGRGTARVFSPPIMPTVVNGVPYISVDMERDGHIFPDRKSGLMLLYGRDVPDDRRRVVTFGRNISLVSDAEYQALTPPEKLQHFPADLSNSDLEYSGIYEDGWISERSFFTLTKKPDDRFLIIRGMVPYIGTADFRSTLHVSVDGKPVATKPLTLGNFEVKLPAAGDGKHRIDLSFDQYQILPGLDGRPTGGKMSFIGYVND